MPSKYSQLLNQEVCAKCLRRKKNSISHVKIEPIILLLWHAKYVNRCLDPYDYNT